MQKQKDTFHEEANVGSVERIASGIIGAGLMALGMQDVKKPSIKTCLEFSAAAYLLYRSITAFCPVRGWLEKEYPLQPKEKDASRDASRR